MNNRNELLGIFKKLLNEKHSSKPIKKISYYRNRIDKLIINNIE